MSDAQRMHEALRTIFERICGAFDGASFERRDGYDALFFPAIPIALFHGVWPRDDAAVGALDAALDEFDVPCSVQVRAGETPKFVEEARRLGFTAESEMPGMIIAADDLAASAVDGLEIERLPEAEAPQALPTLAEGFGLPDELFAPMVAPELVGRDGVDLYLGRVDGAPVSTALAFTVGDLVGIFNVATPPEHRGRGYAAALTAAAARGGFARGAKLAFLQSSAMGFGVYRGLGFRQVETYVLMTRP